MIGVVAVDPGWFRIRRRSRDRRAIIAGDARRSAGSRARDHGRDAHIAMLDSGGAIVVDERGWTHDGKRLAVQAAAPPPGARCTIVGDVLFAIDAGGRSYTSAAPARVPPGQVVEVDAALYYVDADGQRLVRYDLAARAAKPVADVGKDYSGAIATDGTDVFVADRERVWTYDVAHGSKRQLPISAYWPAGLAVHAGRLLVDLHGHGAAIGRTDGAATTVIGGADAAPTAVVGWIDDNAVVVTTRCATAQIACWRSATRDGVPELHTLYEAPRGAQIFEPRVAGRALAWLEASGADCSHADALVTANLTGDCE